MAHLTMHRDSNAGDKKIYADANFARFILGDKGDTGNHSRIFIITIMQ